MCRALEADARVLLGLVEPGSAPAPEQTSEEPPHLRRLMRLARELREEEVVVALQGVAKVMLEGRRERQHRAWAWAGAAAPSPAPEAWKHMRDEDERYWPTLKDEQWALGVTFYWMLADVLPFGEREDSLLTMTRRVLREQPKAPHRINPRVPPELAASCLRMLEKNPEDRYADLREMCGELRRVLETSVGEASWEVPLGQPDAPECRTTEIDERILAAKGLELEFAKIWRPRRGRVRKRPEVKALAEPPAEAAPVPEAEPPPLPEPAAVVVSAPIPEPAQLAPSPAGGRQGIVTALTLLSMGMPADWSMHPLVPLLDAVPADFVKSSSA